jgi:DNA invertase Pin-like site-specific DNA recombinase
MKALPGDAVAITNLARLARPSRDLRNIISELRGCGFVSLGHSWRDTTTDVGRLVLAKG